MKKQFLFCFCLLGILVSSQNLFSAEKISLTSCNWEPYTGESLYNYGFTSEIITEAFKRVGYEAKFTFLPWKRALHETLLGQYDAVYSAYYSDDRAKEYALSDPYIQTDNMLCALKEARIIFSELSDLRPYTIGVVGGYVNSPEFDKATYLKKDETSADLNNIQKLFAKRINLIVIDRYVAIYYIKNSSVINGDISNIIFYEPPIMQMPVHVMFSKAIPGYEKKLLAFNTGLKQIRDDGTINRIMIKHGFVIPN